MKKTKLELLWDLTEKTCLIESSVNTWHLNNFLYDAAEIMGWNYLDGNLNNAQANLRRVLNRWVKEGRLKKIRTGTGFLGKTDFGVCHSNQWFLPGSSIDKLLLQYQTNA